MSDREFDMKNPDDREAAMAAKWAEAEERLAAMREERDQSRLMLGEKLVAMTAQRDKAVEALKALIENIGECYRDGEDEIGACAVCGVVSYKECRPSCEKRKAKELIEELEKVK